MITKEKAKELKLQSIDINETFGENNDDILRKIKELIPNLVNSDNVLSIKALSDILDISKTTSNNQGYELTFAGKGIAKAKADIPTTKELKAEIKQSKDFENTQNIIIRGDNIDVLKILKQNYYEKIKMIYIDPPYNTGNDGFVYNDNFKESEQNLIEKFALNEESVDYLTNIYGTKTHSAWLSFMYPRLKLARDLLKDDGVIFISIDDNEQANLKILCDEIFGEENFVAQMIWEKVKIRKNSALYFTENHDYILCYAKKAKSDHNDIGWSRNLVDRQENNYKNPDNDPNGSWIKGSILANNPYSADYTITKPNGVVLQRPKNAYWRYSRESIDLFIKNNQILWGDGDAYPMVKRYEKDVQNGLVPKTILEFDDVGGNPHGAIELKQLFNDEKIFNNSKPSKLIHYLLKLATNPNDIILDFFAGSGTTAHAVMELNKQDGGNRKFILAQWDEKIDKDKSKQAYDFCTSNDFEPFISSITIERVNRAGEKLKKENGLINDLDIGYKVFSLTDKPSVDENFALLHPRAGVAEKLYNMLVATNKPLHAKIEIIEENALYRVENSFYAIDSFKTDIETLKDFEIYIDAYSTINLEKYLNLDIINRENIRVVY